MSSTFAALLNFQNLGVFSESGLMVLCIFLREETRITFLNIMSLFVFQTVEQTTFFEIETKFSTVKMKGSKF
jgi:hypothetical protein